MKILHYPSANVFWMDKTGFRCPTIVLYMQPTILHIAIHNMHACVDLNFIERKFQCIPGWAFQLRISDSTQWHCCLGIKNGTLRYPTHNWRPIRRHMVKNNTLTVTQVICNPDIAMKSIITPSALPSPLDDGISKNIPRQFFLGWIVYPVW